ncbi:hypothetical protein HDIA_1328 [Hartmannibacter diazotrophicus]|uniref:Uncharacterized protein n=1 Tax=Hartmannibacter diazotrophicus TaxID=1482074 RepID=A0A2C9D3W2_9HYPH|nr:hypothetical protein [Hartmannibacter diazotrophicus]SON54869.1 hypothetical protein HDIA_1328 [Hartmannibacter diazotrophicus]
MGLVIEFGMTRSRPARRSKPERTGEIMFFPGVRIERHAAATDPIDERHRPLPRWNERDD